MSEVSGKKQTVQQTAPVQMNQAVDQETEIDLVELFYMYLGHIWQIIAVLVAGAVLMLCYTAFLVTPQYKATAKIYVVSASNDSVVNLSDLQIGAQLTGDYEQLLKIHPLIDEVISNLQLDMTYNQLLNMLSIDTPTGTRLLNITVESPIPSQAADIANEIAELAMEYLPEIMECAPPNIAEQAMTPAKPSSPSLVKNTVLGGMLAVVIYCGILLVKFVMDDTFKSQEDVEKYLGVTPLCVIPESCASDKKWRQDKAAVGGYPKR